MTTDQPVYLSQGVNYLGFLAQQLGDLRGGKVLAHELIQNADDAKDESGNLAATRITFDIRDEALIVHNDAVFRETDFLRMREVASGSKRSEAGDRTTGAFGVGFISVYQVTDRPEIHSTAKRWVLRPDAQEDRRIEEWTDASITRDKGTLFSLPWAFEDSIVRRVLKASPVTKEYISSFLEELKAALPTAILFLKKLEKIELRHNGETVTKVERIAGGNEYLVKCNQEERLWRVFDGSFSAEAQRLQDRFDGHIDVNRSSQVRVAVSDSFIDDGLLYATLPTEQVTGLPFHIDADFFPAADRKSIPFGDFLDFRSEWNRAALDAAAEAVTSNLIELRDSLGDAPAAFWRVLDQVYAVNRGQSDNEQMPLGAFWESLLTELPTAPIVFTKSRKWLAPRQTRIVTGRDEETAIPAFQALGFQTVHDSLTRSRNTLTQSRVGVKGISAEDIRNALREKGLYGQPTCVPPELSDRLLLRLLWQGVHGVVRNAQGASRAAAEAIVSECSLAPGIDGRLWPCRAVFRTDKNTRQVFAQLLADNISFLAEKDVSLLERLCPAFTVSDALEILESIDPGTLEDNWTRGDFHPNVILQWFDRNKAHLTDTLRQRLVNLPIYPSASGLNPLEDLWLPGGFDDPIGVADLLDTTTLGGLLDFLRSLGVKELRFEDYANRYIPVAFSPNSIVRDEAKRNLLGVLERHIGEVRNDSNLKALLSKLNIVECADGVFRLPAEVYIPSDEIMSVLGHFANYAKLPPRSEGRLDLYSWLGVANNLRLKDVLRVIQASIINPPSRKNRAIVHRMLEVLGAVWTSLSDYERESCEQLRNLHWLPSEGDAKAWHRPNELHAAYRKPLFASQADFIDIPLTLQRQISDFLRYFGLNVNPHPRLVVRHLLMCSERNVPPPSGIYQWLNDNANPADLKQMKDFPCLWVGKRYFSPKQAYWGSHSFGNYRVQLGPDLRSFQKLLSALEIRESQDHHDAIEVLKEVSAEVGNGYAREEIESVVLQCWLMLSDALKSGLLDSNRLKNDLQNTKCVPNKLKQLKRPFQMFLEDRPSLVDKFPQQLEGNVIGRIDGAWIAMEAAGVAPVSQAVHRILVDTENPRSDEEMKKRIVQRAILIKTICEDASNGIHGNSKGDSVDEMLNEIRLVRTDQFTVKWRLQAFKREWQDTVPEPAVAYWKGKDETLYFSQPEGGIPPWSAIAREMAHAVVPEARLASVSPGLKSILEADTLADAHSQLIELGIPSIEKLGLELAQGQIVDSFDDYGREDVENESLQDLDYVIPPAADGVRGNHQDWKPEPESEFPFAKRFHLEQTLNPARTGRRPIWLPEGGPKTSESAREDTERSVREGRMGSHVSKAVTRWQLEVVAQSLADEFRTMIHGDYGKRCQICSGAFAIRGGELQVYVAHVVPPSGDSRTNHFGDLLGLCGWHFSLMRYGEWCFLDPATDQPFIDSNGVEGWRRMLDFVVERPENTDDLGTSYVGLPVRFYNIYQNWDSEPITSHEEIRYSIPHWKYLCELLKT